MNPKEGLTDALALSLSGSLTVYPVLLELYDPRKPSALSSSLSIGNLLAY
ncbi:hypothetical protein DY000_02001965 [Brassica cretica]|uniref:Uncharacterized protein n=1 Tax=Brassica cretica TaxID=69181 RepID=A0ABQ7C7L2_BRACR|nr:hypothetical protein DY000_02001965 [Brassica cretica]